MMRKNMLFISFLALVQYAFAQTHKKDAELIKSVRAASNEAIANHDVSKLATFWLDDLVLIRGNSTHITGKDSIVSAWEQLFKANPKINYIRTTSQIIISSNDSLAWETGTWKAFNSYSNGGNYSAMWKKSNNVWKIQAELFVSLF